MTTLTLLTRIYNSHQLPQMEAILEKLVEGLDVTAAVTGTLANRWVQVEIAGEDEAVLTKLLERDVGFSPVTLANVKKFVSLKGYIVNLEKSNDSLLVDIGVSQPEAVYAEIPLKHLQSELAGGKKPTLKQLAQLWGFSDNLPIKIKTLNTSASENKIEAHLQDTQIAKFINWRDSLLDRLIVIGASQDEVSQAIDHAGIHRDVIEVETLGIFEHALVCKLGTDAAGLVGAVGRLLRKAKFTVFNPKKISND